MNAISAFLKNPKNMFYEGEDHDEHILYIIRKSHWVNVGWAFGSALMIVAPVLLAPFSDVLFGSVLKMLNPFFILMILASWYLFAFGLWLFNFLNWYFNVYIITNKKIVDFDFYGLTYKNISDTLIVNVQDVTAKINGPLHMILNIGDVYIQTAAEKREFDFAGVDDPGKLRDLISDLAADVKHGGRDYD
jgi:membrane protein YdbS with pleckstrin-like domain